MFTRMFDSYIVIVTESVDGDAYSIEANSIEEVVEDWESDCMAVPEKDARVFLAYVDGKILNNGNKCMRFEDLMQHLEAMIS